MCVAPRASGYESPSATPSNLTGVVLSTAGVYVAVLALPMLTLRLVPGPGPAH